MAYKFACSHCGRSFELETPEAKECPFCYWSSTVKRQDEAALAREKGSRETAGSGSRGNSGTGQGRGGATKTQVWRLFFFLALCAGLALAGYIGYKKGYKKFFAASAQKDGPFSIKPFLKGKAPPSVSIESGIAALSAPEKEILYGEVTLTADRTPSPFEQEILSRIVRFETGWAEKIPSVSWSLDQYLRMLDEQERSYKISFARSYKNKLTDLFKSQYLAGAEAFAKGDLLAARDFWIGSLAFPLYSTDLRKHRAVALTMLRPFINDTLAKIGAMNQSLADKGRRLQEEALSTEYQKLAALIAQKQWAEALKADTALLSQVMQLQQNAKKQEPLPPYPASFGTVDADIQRPLMALMETNPASSADLQPLQQDLVEKRDVLQTFTEAYVQSAGATYQKALALIREKKWEEAISALESFSGPQTLQEDAARKAEILKKVTRNEGSLAKAGD